MNNLYIIESSSHKLFELLGLIEEKKEKVIVKEATQDEWLIEAKKLKEFGKTEQANEIIRNTKSIEEATEKEKLNISDTDYLALKNEVLDSKTFNKKAKDRLFNIAIIRDDVLTLFNLKNLKYTPADKFLQKNSNAFLFQSIKDEDIEMAQFLLQNNWGEENKSTGDEIRLC